MYEVCVVEEDVDVVKFGGECIDLLGIVYVELMDVEWYIV